MTTFGAGTGYDAPERSIERICNRDDEPNESGTASGWPSRLGLAHQPKLLKKLSLQSPSDSPLLAQWLPLKWLSGPLDLLKREKLSGS